MNKSLNNNKNQFNKQIGGRRVQGRFQVVKMELNGPTWSQKGTKREPKAIKMEPKALKLIIYVEKGSQKGATNL